MKYQASKGKEVVLLTALAFTILISATILSIHQIVVNQNKDLVLIHTFLIISYIIIILLSYAYAPRHYTIKKGELIINRILKPISIPLSSVNQVSQVDKKDMKGMIRIMGVGGFFGNYGKYKNKHLGSFTMYSTQSRNYILVKSGNKKIVITPDSPKKFILDISKLLQS